MSHPFEPHPMKPANAASAPKPTVPQVWRIAAADLRRVAKLIGQHPPLEADGMVAALTDIANNLDSEADEYGHADTDGGPDACA